MSTNNLSSADFEIPSCNASSSSRVSRDLKRAYEEVVGYSYDDSVARKSEESARRVPDGLDSSSGSSELTTAPLSDKESSTQPTNDQAYRAILRNMGLSSSDEADDLQSLSPRPTRPRKKRRKFQRRQRSSQPLRWRESNVISSNGATPTSCLSPVPTFDHAEGDSGQQPVWTSRDSSISSFLPRDISTLPLPANLVGTNIAFPNHHATFDIAKLLIKNPLGLGMPPLGNPSSSTPTDSQTSHAKILQRHAQQNQALLVQQQLELQQFRQREAQALLSNPTAEYPPVLSSMPPSSSRLTNEAPASQIGGESKETILMMTTSRNVAVDKTCLMYQPTDDEVLSDFQILLRKNIEYFEAEKQDLETTLPGRRTKLLSGQIGLRCRHCRSVAANKRATATVYFPSKLHRLYQSAQNIATTHLMKSCTLISPEMRKTIESFHQGGKKASAGHAGKEYWSNCARALGVVETDAGGLRFT